VGGQGVGVDHRPQVVVGEPLDLGDLAGGAEAVEEVEEGEAAGEGGGVGHRRQVLGFLHEAEVRQGEAGLADPMRRCGRRRC